MEDVISLGIGEPDFVSPRPVIDAAVQSLYDGKTGYTANAGIFELRERIAADLTDLYGVRYDPSDQILVTVGASEAMQLAMLSLLDDDRARGPVRLCRCDACSRISTLASI